MLKDYKLEIDFFKFALLCNEKQLLNSWIERNEYCLNVMNIINCNDKKQSKKIKNKKANGNKIWNLELISNNRIEIRTMGGINYHKNSDKILYEVEAFRNIFKETLSKDTDKYMKLKEFHLERIKNATPDAKIEFMKMIKAKKQ